MYTLRNREFMLCRYATVFARFRDSESDSECESESDGESDNESQSQNESESESGRERHSDSESYIDLQAEFECDWIWKEASRKRNLTSTFLEAGSKLVLFLKRSVS